MKKIIAITFFSCLLVTGIHAQLMKDNEIVGDWKIVDVQVLNNESIPKEAKKKMEMLRQGFMSGKFHFGADKKCSFKCSFEDFQIDKGHWKYNAKEKKFDITSWEEEYKKELPTMSLYGKIENGKTLFLLDETNLVVVVEKQ